MQFLIIGSGKVGSSLARKLTEHGHEVVIIDSKKEYLENVKDIDCIKVHGVPIDQDVLKSAGIDFVDAVCAVSRDDNMNIMTSQVAKEIFGVKRVVTRIFDPKSKELFEEFGLETICSTSITVNAIFRILEGEEEKNKHIICGEDVVFTELKPESRYYGMEINEYSKTYQKHIAAIKRNNDMIVALPGMRIEKDDILVILSKND